MFFLSCCGLVLTYIFMAQCPADDMETWQYLCLMIPSGFYIHSLYLHWYDLGMSWIFFLLGVVYLVTAKVSSLDNKNHVVGLFAFVVAIASFIACYANFTADRPPVGFFY